MSTSYATSDFPTAVTLLVLKYFLETVDRSNPRRAIFIFERSPELEEDIKKIQSGQTKVDPLDFWSAQKRLKQALYGERG